MNSRFLGPQIRPKKQELLLPFLQDPVFIDTGTLAGSHLVEFKAHMPEVYRIIYICTHTCIHAYIYKYMKHMGFTVNGINHIPD